MPFDNNTFDTDIDTTLENVGNEDNSTNANATVTLDEVGNVDNSTNDNDVWDVGVDDSFKNNSGNEDWDIEDSGNHGSYNDWVTVTDESYTDNSVNAGVREYNLGFSGGAAAEGMGGDVHGDLWVNNQNTVVDQSASNNILSGGGVFQFSANESVVASGDGALAAGDDITVSQSLDRSTTINADGDVLIDSEKHIDVAIGSNNVTNVDVDIVDSSQDWDFDNVGNDYSATLSLNDSFNDVDTDVSVNDWDVDANVIWDSEDAIIADDIDVDLDI